MAPFNIEEEIMFNATYFTYDGIYSGDYGIQIASLESDNIETTSVFAPTLSLSKGARSKRFFYSGIQYEDSPEYQFSILSEREIPDTERRKILSWLVGRKEFKKLRIHQQEFDDVYFNCIFTAADIVYVRGRCFGFTVTAKFDSPYCYGKPTKKTITCTAGTPAALTIYNKSDVLDDYVYPTITFSENVSIRNITDGSRVTSYSGVKSLETITIDGELKIVNSNLGGDKLSNFNLNWLRLKPGKNELEITGQGEVTITCPQYLLLGF